jgi:hypothetical protein
VRGERREEERQDERRGRREERQDERGGRRDRMREEGAETR